MSSEEMVDRYDQAYDLNRMAGALRHRFRWAEAADAYEVEADAWEAAGRPDIGRLAKLDVEDCRRWALDASMSSPPPITKEGA